MQGMIDFHDTPSRKHPMTITMYDLAGAEDERRFSPFCWRIRMALAHKELDFETVPWRFTERDDLPQGNRRRVPVIVDSGRVIPDSWEIACYLDEQYADRPPLFGSEIAKAEALFIKHWSERVLQSLIVQIVVFDIFQHIHPKDKAYFRENREKRFGKKLEDIGANSDQIYSDLQQALSPLRATIELQPFMCGKEPAFADYIVFGTFQWARSVSDKPMIAADDPIYEWRGRMMELFDGMGASTLAYSV